jgi:hypothetical protein
MGSVKICAASKCLPFRVRFRWHPIRRNGSDVDQIDTGCPTGSSNAN